MLNVFACRHGERAHLVKGGWGVWGCLGGRAGGQGSAGSNAGSREDGEAGVMARVGEDGDAGAGGVWPMRAGGLGLKHRQLVVCFEVPEPAPHWFGAWACIGFKDPELGPRDPFHLSSRTSLRLLS